MPLLKNKTGFLVNLATTLTKNNKRVIYIAGKVTGLEPEMYISKFKAAQKKLEADGWKVLNPCNFIGPEESWETAMRMAAAMLCMADTVYMLSCWPTSKGAQCEFELATKFGIPVVFE